MQFVCSLHSDSINSQKNAYVQRATAHEFSVAHYTGKVTYDVRDMADKNRDFLPPEMVTFILFIQSRFSNVTFHRIYSLFD